MHLKCDNIIEKKMWKSEILIYDKVDEVIEKLFESPLKRHPIDLETLTKGSEFLFNFFHLFYNKGHKLNFYHGVSLIDSTDWIKNHKNNNKSCHWW